MPEQDNLPGVKPAPTMCLIDISFEYGPHVTLELPLDKGKLAFDEIRKAMSAVDDRMIEIDHGQGSTTLVRSMSIISASFLLRVGLANPGTRPTGEVIGLQRSGPPRRPPI